MDKNSLIRSLESINSMCDVYLSQNHSVPLRGELLVAQDDPLLDDIIKLHGEIQYVLKHMDNDWFQEKASEYPEFTKAKYERKIINRFVNVLFMSIFFVPIGMIILIKALSRRSRIRSEIKLIKMLNSSIIHVLKNPGMEELLANS